MVETVFFGGFCEESQGLPEPSSACVRITIWAKLNHEKHGKQFAEA
jgi:hypothetical protein